MKINKRIYRFVLSDWIIHFIHGKKISDDLYVIVEFVN